MKITAKLIKFKKGGIPLQHETSKKVGQGTTNKALAGAGPNNSEIAAPIEQSDSDNLYAIGKKSQAMEKTLPGALNTGMTKKSLFDTLCEEVLDNPADVEAQDLEALDVDIDGEGDGMEGDMEGDEVSITLPREIAQQFFDALSAQLSGEEGLGEDEFGEDEFGEEGLGDEELGDEGAGAGGNPFGEGCEATLKPVSKTQGLGLTKTNNKAGSVKASGGKAQPGKLKVAPAPAAVSKTQGLNLTKPGSMKVNAGKASKVGAGLFD
jgi:hypothetical protein